jgi:hypothetical protein
MLQQDKHTEIHLDLWKYVTDDAGKIKDRMWTMASWMFALLAGLLAFSVKYFSGANRGDLKIENPVLIIVIGILGIVLSGYAMFMIQQYEQHIRNMWNRSDLVRREIRGLCEIWFLNLPDKIIEDKEKNRNEQTVPPVAKRLIYLAVGFGMVFISLLFLALL